jgi:hypothetical protein
MNEHAYDAGPHHLPDCQQGAVYGAPCHCEAVEAADSRADELAHLIVWHLAGGNSATVSFLRGYSALSRRVAELEGALAWQPIETAPRDGFTVILLRIDGQSRAVAGFYNPADEAFPWCFLQPGNSAPGEPHLNAYTNGGAVTGWMPLPTPPAAALKGQG